MVPSTPARIARRVPERQILAGGPDPDPDRDAVRTGYRPVPHPGEPRIGQAQRGLIRQGIQRPVSVDIARVRRVKHPAGFEAVQEARRFSTGAHAFLVTAESLVTQIGLVLCSRHPPLGPLHRPTRSSGCPAHPVCSRSCLAASRTAWHYPLPGTPADGQHEPRRTRNVTDRQPQPPRDPPFWRILGMQRRSHMKRPVKLLLVLCLVCWVIGGLVLVGAPGAGRAGLASWPGLLPARAGGGRGHRGAQRSRSDAAGALEYARHGRSIGGESPLEEEVVLTPSRRQLRRCEAGWEGSPRRIPAPGNTNRV